MNIEIMVNLIINKNILKIMNSREMVKLILKKDNIIKTKKKDHFRNIKNHTIKVEEGTSTISN